MLRGNFGLDHPFYRRWEAGTLARGELARYAEQYRYIEAALPGVLSRVASCLPEGSAREAVTANLSDELGNPAPHLELFEAFAAAAGARQDVPPTPATQSLVALQLSSVTTDSVRALGVLAAYETQAAAVAASKAAGLRCHYGIDGPGAAFWDVHADLEADHGDWSASALAATADSPMQVTSAVAAGASAWWQFLDERDAAAYHPSAVTQQEPGTDASRG
jgi:pyrroloquinoline quinone (PQQ) biosynthesis protein C